MRQIRYFLRERVWCAAYILAGESISLRNIRDEPERENAVSEVARRTVDTLLGQLDRGQLTPPSRPIENLRAYAKSIVEGHARDRNRTKTPRRITEIGPLGVDMFQRVVVYQEDLYEVQRDLELRHPDRQRYIRTEVVPVITEELANPDPRAKRATRAPSPISSLLRGEPNKDDALDPIEHRNLAMGRRPLDPAEELIQQLNHEALLTAIGDLPEPQREWATAYFLDQRVSGPKDFEITFGVKNGQYEIKKLFQALARSLSYLAR